MYKSVVRFMSSIVLVLAAVSGAVAQGQLDLPGREVARRAFSSVVMLVTDERGQEGVFGSGFVVAPRVVATNYHVIKDAEAVYGRVVGSRSVHRMGRILASDPRRDLALLFFPDLEAPVLPIAVDSVAAGDTIYVVGSPEGLEGTLSKGIVSSVRQAEGVLQIDAAVSHGSSGGPVIDQAGAVVGVVVATAKTGQNLNFAIPASFLVLITREAKLTPRIYSPPAVGSVASSKQLAFDRISELYRAERYDLALEAAAAAAASWPNDPLLVYYAGVCAYSADKPSVAIDYYRAAISLYPKDGVVWGELARAYRSVGYLTKDKRWFEESATAGREALRMGGVSAEALKAIAHSFEDVGRFDEAVDVQQRIAAATPSDPEPRISLAHLYRKSERWREAHAAFRKYLDLGGTRTEYVLNCLGDAAVRSGARDEARDAYLEALDGETFSPHVTYTSLWKLMVEDRQFVQAVETGKRELIKHPRIAVDGVWSLLYELEKVQQREMCIELLAALTGARPNDGDSLLLIANAYSRLGRHEDALSLARRARHLLPLNYRALDRIGEELAILKRNGEGIAAFEQADILAKGLKDDDRRWSLERLFELYRDAKKFNEALSVAKRMERVSERSWPVILFLETAYQDIGRPDDVIPYCERHIARDPADEMPVAVLARTHEKAKRFDLAASAFKKYLAVSSKPDPTAMIALGRIMELDGRRTEASELYRLALQQPSETSYPLVRLAAVHEEFGRLEEAEALHVRAIRIEPTNPERLFEFGVFLHRQGRREEALAQYSKLQELSMSNEAAKYQASKLFELLFD